jgi:hypothetical protein
LRIIEKPSKDSHPHLWQKCHVKRKRRIEIEIERREISVFSRAASGAGDVPSAAGSAAQGNVTAKPAACPRCGSEEMIPLAEAVTRPEFKRISGQSALESGRIHLHCTAAGEWWVCWRSLRD